LYTVDDGYCDLQNETLLNTWNAQVTLTGVAVTADISVPAISDQQASRNAFCVFFA
jgi:hypothetical protein